MISTEQLNDIIERIVPEINMKCHMAALSLLLLCGCPINLDTEYFAKNKPKNEELVGKYVPSAETLKWVREEGKYPNVETSVELTKDGSFRMVNMPDWWAEPFGKPKGKFDSGVGEWEVTKQQEWWNLKLSFKIRKDFSSKQGDSGGFLTSIPIVGQSVPYRLWFYVGDPDQGKVMILEKKPGAS